MSQEMKRPADYASCDSMFVADDSKFQAAMRGVLRRHDAEISRLEKRMSNDFVHMSSKMEKLAAEVGQLRGLIKTLTLF